MGGHASEHADGSRRLFDVCIPHVARALRFGLLPLAHVANGHSFFVQQLQQQSGVWPLAVHATYQLDTLTLTLTLTRTQTRTLTLTRTRTRTRCTPPTSSKTKPTVPSVSGSWLGFS